MKKKKLNMSFPFQKVHGRLLRKGWVTSDVDITMRVGEEEIPFQMKVYSHDNLGENLSLEEANEEQKIFDQYLKDMSDNRAALYLEETGWTFTENRQWFKPNWDSSIDVAQREKYSDWSDRM